MSSRAITDNRRDSSMNWHSCSGLWEKFHVWAFAHCRMSHSFATTLSCSSSLDPQDTGGLTPLLKLQKEGTQFSSSHPSKYDSLSGVNTNACPWASVGSCKFFKKYLKILLEGGGEGKWSTSVKHNLKLQHLLACGQNSTSERKARSYIVPQHIVMHRGYRAP